MELTEENLEYITFVAMGYCHLPKFNDEYHYCPLKMDKVKN